jgi:hypothetical protein
VALLSPNRALAAWAGRHGLRATYDEIGTRYARILVPGDGGAALVCVSSVKAFDPRRQLCQVPLAPALYPALTFGWLTMRRWRAQIRKCMQIILAEEYDAVVRLDDGFRPLAAAGDRRTGRELLADAAADARLSVSAAAATPRGRAVLEGLVSRARAVRDRFRQCAAAAAAGARAGPAGGGLGRWAAAAWVERRCLSRLARRC